MTDEELRAILRSELDPVRQDITGVRQDIAALERRLATIEGHLAGFTHRFAAMDGRLAHLQTIGTWLIAGLLGSYAAILAVALRVPHP